jgi:WD40 repeat protein
LNLLNRYRPTFGVPALAGSPSYPARTDSLKAGLQTDLRGWEWRYLWSQCQSEADSVFCKPAKAIKSLSVSHDGAWLATGLESTGVSIWDVATGQEITRLPSGGFIVRVAFSPRERLLAY